MSIIKTQGLNLWIAEKNKGLMKVCPTSLELGDVDYEEIDITTLCETETKKTVKGLMSEGEATFGMSFDPNKESHIALYELANDLSDPEAHFIIGCATDSDVTGYDSKLAPTYDASTDEVTLPDKRHWLMFKGAVNKFPFEISGNDVMKTTMAVKQRESIKFIKAQ